MKKQLLLLAGLLIAAVGFPQDQIFLHNGQTINGKVEKVAEYVITYNYQNETAEQVVSKYAVDKIIYGSSGRTEHVTDKVDVGGPEGWQNVVVLEDKSQIAGLTKVTEIKGKSAFINMRSANGTDTKATEDLKKEGPETGL